MREEERQVRQDLLYKLITREPNRWFTQLEIYGKVSGYVWSVGTHDNCSSILADIHRINADPKYEQIILIKDNKFKVADDEELRIYRNKHIKKLKKQVEIVKNIDYKWKLNNQGKVLEEDEFYKTFFWKNLNLLLIIYIGSARIETT